MAYELVSHGIDVTIVQPGGYPTKIWENANKLTTALLERADEERKAAYAIILAAARRNPFAFYRSIGRPKCHFKSYCDGSGQTPIAPACSSWAEATGRN